MAAVRRDAEYEERGLVSTTGLVDYIVARIEADGTSKRQVSAKTGIGRSRLHVVLHTTAAKRSPMRLDEIAVVLDVIGVSQLEATLAAQLLETVGKTNVRAVSNIASMICEMVHGLPEQLADIIEHIDGLEFDDIRREHGRRVRALVVKTLTEEYTELANRREFRIAALQD